MYFSLISPAVGDERAAGQQRLAGPYADHQWLWRWFPEDPAAQRDFLFRRHEGGTGMRYYLVSSRPPADRLGAWQAQTRVYEPQLQAGDRVGFELRANPTVRHGRDGKSKRHDVVMNAKRALLAERGLAKWAEWEGADKPALQPLIHQACTQWLQARGERAGFTLDAEALTVEAYDQHLAQRERGLRLSTVDLAGVMTVTDPAAFQAVLVQGLGPAKAFGCGLLLIRRLH